MMAQSTRDKEIKKQLEEFTKNIPLSHYVEKPKDWKTNDN
jgi:hypothetical protein